MAREINLYIEDILESIDKIEEYTKDITEEDFNKSFLLQDGVIRRIEIIGEAVKNIPQDFRDKYPEIPWQDIAGMRNRLAHEYFGVLIDRAWKVVKKDLPELKSQILLIKQNLP